MKKLDFPEDVNPALSFDHLDLIATVIAFVHDNTLDDLCEEKGDNEWVLGCTCYARFCDAIRKLVASKKFPWLGIADSSMHFVFRVGEVHFRACKGDEDGTPNANALTRAQEEVALNSASYLPGFEAAYEDCVWRFVVVKGENWNVARVELQLVDSESGEWVQKWDMPLKSDITGLLHWAENARYAKLPAADVDDVKFGQRQSDEGKGSVI